MRFVVHALAMIVCLSVLGCGRSGADNSPEALQEFEKEQQEYVNAMEAEYKDQK